MRYKTGILPVISVIIVGFIFGNLFLAIAEFVFEIYHRSVVATFLPFGLVLFLFFAIFVGSLFFLYLILQNIRFGLSAFLIFLPMSALPFILLGYPLVVLDRVFICRSSIVFGALLLAFWWFAKQVSTYSYQKFGFPLIKSIGLLSFLYILNIFVVDKEYIIRVIQSNLVFISCVMFFYFLLSYIKNREKLIYVVRVLIISCIIQAIFSSFSFFYYLIIKGRSTFRVEGMLRDFELFAEYLAIHVPLIFYMIRNEKSVFFKRLFKYSLPGVLFVLFATATRGAVIFLLLSMCYYLFAMRKKLSIPNILKITVVSTIVCITILAILYKTIPASAHIIERFFSTKIATLDTREYVWQKFYEYFRKHPLLGYGLVYDLRSYLFYPHSTYFYYLLTMGIAGLLAYLIFLFSILKRGWMNIKFNKHFISRYELSVALNASLIIFVVDGLKVEYLRYSNYQLFIWTVFALIVSLNQISQDARVLEGKGKGAPLLLTDNYENSPGK